MPDDRPRTIRKRIAIRPERIRAEVRAQAREAATQGRDELILLQRDNSQQQDSIGSHITVRPRSPEGYSTTSISSVDDEPIETTRSQSEPLTALPPASTAPPALQQEEEGRARRKRARSGYYKMILTGDSQEIKRAKY